MAAKPEAGAERETAVEFSDREMALILKSLPEGVTSERLECLASKLREFGRREFPIFRKMGERKLDRSDQKKAAMVASAAGALWKACRNLSPKAQLEIAAQLENRGGPAIDAQPDGPQQLEKTMDSVINVYRAAKAAATPGHVGRPFNIVSLFVIIHLARMFEGATRLPSTRVVDRVENSDAGPFYNFAAAVWSFFGTATTVSLLR